MLQIALNNGVCDESVVSVAEIAVTIRVLGQCPLTAVQIWPECTTGMYKNAKRRRPSYSTYRAWQLTQHSGRRTHTSLHVYVCDYYWCVVVVFNAKNVLTKLGINTFNSSWHG